MNTDLVLISLKNKTHKHTYRRSTTFPSTNVKSSVHIYTVTLFLYYYYISYYTIIFPA